MEPKNMKECDKRNSPYKRHMIYISSNDFRHPVALWISAVIS